VYGLKTRKMGDNALVDVHLLVDPHISVSEGHYIAESARARLKADPQVLDVMVHIDPEMEGPDDTIPVDLPMRPELLARTREVFLPLGVPVVAIDLHYLNHGIDLDVFIGSAMADGAPTPEQLAQWAALDTRMLAERLRVRTLRLYGALTPKTGRA
jgi:hypothetical protein